MLWYSTHVATCQTVRALLASQRFDGVDSCSAACRDVTCNKRRYHQNSRGATEGGGIDGRDAKEQRRHQAR